MKQLLIKTDFERVSVWRSAASDIFSDWDILFWPEEKAKIDKGCQYALVWAPDEQLYEALPNLKVLFSVGAGVDHIDFNSVPKHVPIIRMVDEELRQGMQDFVLSCVLDFSRYLYIYREMQHQSKWHPLIQKSNKEWKVLVMGMGELGSACAQSLCKIGFNVMGYARSERSVEGVTIVADEASLSQHLSESDIVINLMPLTPATELFFDANRFSQFKKGAAFINVARGNHVEENALKRALDNRIERCYLDVFAHEPLAATAWQWAHPKVQATPHIASMTYPITALAYVHEQIRRHQKGDKLANIVDRKEGY